jgi:L-2,4-diaminobutyrate decarboxylase
MRADALEEAIAQAEGEGFEPFCVVATSGTTPVGAYDPIPELAEVCERRKLWLHVDGAHGASAAFSRRFRKCVAGLERANSITWDAHKMLFVPSLATFLLFRDAARSYGTFQQDAPYLYDPENRGDSIYDTHRYDAGLRTLECTRPMLSTGLWGIWSLHGDGLFEDLIDNQFDLARLFHRLLDAAPDFEPLHFPEANILCFRHVPERLRGDEPALDRLQVRLRNRLVESGRFYLTGTRLDGRSCLRVTLMNPFTESSHLEEMLQTLREQAAAIL